MAVEYTITEARDEGMTFDGSGDSLKITWNKTYVVEVADPLNADFDPATIDIYNVQTATGLPVVNKTIYSVDGKIIPWVVCRSVAAKRDPKRIGRYKITTRWDTGNRKDIDVSLHVPLAFPNSLSEIPPRVETELGEIALVLYEDKQSQPIMTPTGNYYAEPAMERIPTKTHRITQYEPSITFDEMLERKLKVNLSEYRGEERFAWLIEEIEAIEVDVRLDSGVVEAAMVTYTIAYNPRENGWMDDRALIDTHYINGSGSKVAFTDDEYRSYTVGFVKVDGTDNTSASTPDHVQFETQGDIDFDTFLQV